MGMSTHIQAFTPDTDKEFQRHKKILLACIDGEVSLPPETSKYFGNETSAYERLIDEKLSVELKKGVHYKDWSDDSSSGFEVDLTKLPQGVTKLRFYNNW